MGLSVLEIFDYDKRAGRLEKTLSALPARKKVSYIYQLRSVLACKVANAQKKVNISFQLYISQKYLFNSIKNVLLPTCENVTV